MFGDADDEVAATPVVEVVGERTERVEHGFRVPSLLEFKPLPFDHLAVEQLVNVDRKRHEAV
jgi:hypothetical protein